MSRLQSTFFVTVAAVAALPIAAAAGQCGSLSDDFMLHASDKSMALALGNVVIEESASGKLEISSIVRCPDPNYQIKAAKLREAAAIVCDVYPGKNLPVVLPGEMPTKAQQKHFCDAYRRTFPALKSR